jgi:hypothetical protein
LTKLTLGILKYGSVSGYIKEIFSFQKAYRPAPRAHSTSCLVDKSFSEIMQPGHESDLSPPCSVEVKNKWIYKSVSSFVIK